MWAIRLISFTLTTWGTCVLMSLLALSISRAQPIGTFINGLSLCDGKVCYLHIVPGRTSWEEAKRQVADFQPIDLFEKTNFTLPDYQSFMNLPGFHGRLLLIPNQDPITGDKIVSELDLSPTDNSTYLGAAILQFGVPCAAVRLGRDNLGLVYPGISVIAQMHQVGNYLVVRPTSPVIQANLFQRIESCEDVDLSRTQGDFEWHGFVRYAESSG